jgi:membrane associated rhomboid family serine protease
MVTKIIAVVVFIVSLQAFNNTTFFERFKHSPYKVVHDKEYYRMLTSGFLHGSWAHLLINLFVFWQFGNFVENSIFYSIFGTTVGAILYLLLVLLSIIVGNIHSTIQNKDNYYYGSIGLSGAVSAILFSYVLINPWSKIYLYAIIPIYTIVAALLYLGYSQWASKNSRDNVDHSAHFYGAIFGLVYTIAVYPKIVLYFIDRLVEGFPF